MADQTLTLAFLRFVLLVEFLVVVQQDLLVQQVYCYGNKYL